MTDRLISWGLVVLLALIVYGNAEDKGKLKQQCETRIAEAVNAGLEQAQAEANAKAEAIRQDAEKDRADLIAQVEALRKRGPERVTVYRYRVRDVPVTAKCGPGQARVDALNEALR